jgi:hypothetical protein
MRRCPGPAVHNWQQLDDGVTGDTVVVPAAQAELQNGTGVTDDEKLWPVGRTQQRAVPSSLIVMAR